MTDTPSPRPAVQRVVVTDLDISFGSMVGLILKATIAAIPALLILVALALGLGAIVGGCAAVLGGLAGS
jgi:uncharacterized membrane protein YdjX (TVP38/TMEM64 family)